MLESNLLLGKLSENMQNICTCYVENELKNNTYLVNLNPLSKQLSVCRYVSVLRLSRAAVLQPGAPLCVLPPLIRLLPFLRLSLTRQKATWGMAGPTWLTLAALVSPIFILLGKNCWQLISRWISSTGNSLLGIFFFKRRSHSAALSDWAELRCC